MFYITDAYLESLIAEDMPYLDLSSHLLGIDDALGTISYFTREDCMVCGTEEVVRIMAKLGIEIVSSVPSGSVLAAGDDFLVATGRAGALHAAWKVCLNIFDHLSAVATKTRRVVDAVHSVATTMPLLTTRKSMPGTKPLLTKAVVTGGAIPHRLGLSETVLIFANHTSLIGGFDGLLKKLPEVLASSCEKKVFVEATADQAFELAGAGVDGVQFDKLKPAELIDLVPQLRQINPALTLIASGGINENNAAEYAATGVDGLATTALFTAKPLDMSARIEPV